MESPCLSTRQQALKVGCFYWLRVKKFELPSYRIELGSCLFRPMASLPPPSSPLHRLDLIEFVPNQILIESHIEIVRRSFIHCLIRLPVARKLPLVARWLRLVANAKTSLQISPPTTSPCSPCNLFRGQAAGATRENPLLAGNPTTVRNQRQPCLLIAVIASIWLSQVSLMFSFVYSGTNKRSRRSKQHFFFCYHEMLQFWGCGISLWNVHHGLKLSPYAKHLGEMSKKKSCHKRFAAKNISTAGLTLKSCKF